MAMARSIIGSRAVSVAALLFFSAVAALLPTARSTSFPLDPLPHNAHNDSSLPWPIVNLADLAAAGDNHSTDYHAATCPSLEFIVQTNVDNAINVDASIAGGLRRVTPPQGPLERGAVRAERVPEPEVYAADRGHPHHGARAVRRHRDILTLATRRAVVRARGVAFPVRLGRDDNVAPATHRDVAAAIPSPRTADAAALLAAFAAGGLADPSDLVALSGAHSIGKAHCASFADRAAEFNTDFNRKLFRDCRSDAYTVEDLDYVTPRELDNQYYRNLYMGEGVLSSDMALLSNPLTAMWVRYYNEHPQEFLNDFSAKMDKLYNVPRTGFGEIRRCSCFRTNNGRFGKGHADSA
ncbi:unnamed protein product [Urochloa decumbens]|uniref:Peroxidase n=1 Tax=Urochloa decumbens TaxID=240449 RepID=A0ABC9HGF8_9POAL